MIFTPGLNGLDSFAGAELQFGLGGILARESFSGWLKPAIERE